MLPRDRELLQKQKYYYYLYYETRDDDGGVCDFLWLNATGTR
jgi:hypothetical protein